MDSIVSRAPRATRAPEHHLEFVVAFEESSCLLVSGWVHDPDARVASVILQLAAADYVVDESISWYRRPDVLAHFNAEETEQLNGFWLLTTVGAGDLSGRLQISFAMKDGSRCAGEHREIASYEAETHGKIQSLLAKGSRRSSRDLLETRPHPVELLRSLAIALPSEISRLAAGMDKVVVMPDGVLLAGWLYNPEPALERLLLMDESSRQSVDFLDAVSWCHRADVSAAMAAEPNANGDHGFVAFVPLEGVRAGSRLALYVQTPSSKLFRIPLEVSQPVPPVSELQHAVLGALPPGAAHRAELMQSHLGPALTRVLAHRWSNDATPRSVPFGAPPEDPEVTVAILLEQDPDALRYQLATFCDDPDLATADLLYVPRTTASAEASLALAQAIHGHFDVPFRLLDGVRTSSTAEAVNLAAREARGQLLLVMSCNVLPRQAGWLSALVDAFRRMGDAGAIGPRLLREDGTIFQGATRFAPSPVSAGWLVAECPARGFPPSLAAESVEVAPVDALSLDCLLVETKDFLAVGGVPQDYIRGEFANLELCCRLSIGQRRLYYAPTICLDLSGREEGHRQESWSPGDLYDCWFFNERCKQLLREIRS